MGWMSDQLYKKQHDQSPYLYCCSVETTVIDAHIIAADPIISIKGANTHLIYFSSATPDALETSA
jgi:hypothetical protein